MVKYLAGAGVKAWSWRVALSLTASSAGWLIFVDGWG